MMFRIKCVRARPEGDCVHYLTGLDGCWNFSNDIRKAIKLSLGEAFKAIRLYFASDGPDDGGKTDCLIIERIKDGQAVYEGYSRFHPEKKRSILLDELLARGKSELTISLINSPTESMEKPAGRPYKPLVVEDRLEID